MYATYISPIFFLAGGAAIRLIWHLKGDEIVLCQTLESTNLKLNFHIIGIFFSIL